jgi:hypothetical protein
VARGRVARLIDEELEEPAPAPTIGHAEPVPEHAHPAGWIMLPDPSSPSGWVDHEIPATGPRPRRPLGFRTG